jgi:hypothetical protein
MALLLAVAWHAGLTSVWWTSLHHSYMTAWLENGGDLDAIGAAGVEFQILLRQQSRARFLLLEAALKEIQLDDLNMFNGVRINIAALRRGGAGKPRRQDQATRVTVPLPAPVPQSAALALPWLGTGAASPTPQAALVRQDLLRVPNGLATYTHPVTLSLPPVPRSAAWTFGVTHRCR